MPGPDIEHEDEGDSSGSNTSEIFYTKRESRSTLHSLNLEVEERLGTLGSFLKPPTRSTFKRRSAVKMNAFINLQRMEPQEAQEAAIHTRPSVSSSYVPPLPPVAPIAEENSSDKFQGAVDEIDNSRRAVDKMRHSHFFGRKSISLGSLGSEKGSLGSEKEAQVGMQVHLYSRVAKACIVKLEPSQDEALGSPEDVLDKFLLRRSGLQSPNLVISIMGGAGQFHTDDMTFDTAAFQKGLVEAALKTGSWIITGGTDSGVMRLVGKSLRAHDRQQRVPCIGVTTLGCLISVWREALKMGSDDDDVEAPNKHDVEAIQGEEKLAALQPNHTHFVLVDAGKEGSSAFGSEIQFRDKLEICIAKNRRAKGEFRVDDRVIIKKQEGDHRELIASIINIRNNKFVEVRTNERRTIICKESDLELVNEEDSKQRRNSDDSLPSEKEELVKCVASSVSSNVPRVMILVNGGGYSLVSVVTCLESGCPVVVCKGTGRAADAICTLLQERFEDQYDIWVKVAKFMPDEARDEKKWEQAQKNLRTIRQHKSAIQVFENGTRLDEKILRAVLENPVRDNDGAKDCLRELQATWQQLVLAVGWRLDEHFNDLGERLIHDFIQNLHRIWTKNVWNPEISKRVSLKGSQIDQEGTIIAIELIFTELVAASSPTCQKHMSRNGYALDVAPLIKWLVNNHKRHMARIKSISRDKDPTSSNNNNKDKVQGNCSLIGIISEPIRWKQIADDNSVASDWRASISGLLIWCVEQEASDKVLDLLWLHVDEPVHTALVVASVCREIVDLKHSSRSYADEKHKERLETLAERYETLAQVVIEGLTTNTGTSPEEYLFQSSRRWGNKDAFHLAVFLKCKTFTASEFYRKAVEMCFTCPAVSVDEGDKQFGSHLSKRGSVRFAMRIWSTTMGMRGKSDYIATPEHFNLSMKEYLSIPCIKARTHLVSRVVFLLVYTHSVFTGALVTTGVTWQEMGLLVYGISLAVSEYEQYRYKGATFSLYIDFWNFIDILHIAVLLGGIVSGVLVGLFDFYSWSGAYQTQTSTTVKFTMEVVHALNLLPAFVKIFQVFLLDEYFGTLALALGGMIRDLGHFSILLIISCLMFSAALTPIVFESPAARKSQGITWTFWTVFGEIDSAVRDEINKSFERNTFLWALTYVLLYVLGLLSNVLLVTLLQCVLNQTYEEIKKESHKKWAFYQAKEVQEFNDLKSLPPPFNLLAIIFEKRASNTLLERTNTKHLGGGQKTQRTFFTQKELRYCQENAILKQQKTEPKQAGPIENESLAIEPSSLERSRKTREMHNDNLMAELFLKNAELRRQLVEKESNLTQRQESVKSLSSRLQAQK